ncbi:uncharacterized protein LOC100122128 [Nasonia vitripennis]|uniref:PID domain-containing protein n=1 Tax=Nasonia vitripennis TaxID=7425 RepID=A0A7M7G649_NASVI|nr:uncharacterized protein LOC100122128 [Nasonia vitripennis]XP_008217774.1 uncharacterized protein LOC100122128 [Nasonia vitripennis]XP_031779996.1 uncharacterized protein LOC100122128 [Nasonia vitripennis]XP_032452823.1 uncharacterized protein LOC100122128 [Nasonia vitripennis]XP_032452824.1 uncharacterized protein LOC100122128 [Nasonia vitripennis]
MKAISDVVAEPAKADDMFSAENNNEEIGIVRRGSLDSVDRISLTSSTTTSSSILSGSSELGTRTLRSLKRGLGKLWRRHRGNASITEYDPSYKVAYLGNVLTGWAKGEGCVEKPVSTLWRNYVGSNRPDVSMRLTVTNGGLTATTKDHGLTEYWAHRVTYCTAPASHPRLFVWVYRHEGRRLRPELRCHAALCSKESIARRLASVLNARLQQALLEFRRDKVSRQNARLSLANAVYENPSLPRRKILLSTGGSNYRPPLERSKSAPKLSAIEEDAVAEEIEQQRFLEELRSLEHVARTWQEQEGWRLARLLDALHRESSDENGSISSGCETASTANSEERVSSSEDSQLPLEPEIPNGQRTSGKVLTAAMTTAGSQSPPLCDPSNEGPRRNSDGSPNFMTCAGSPRFRRRSSRQTRTRSRKLQQIAADCSSFSLSRSEGEESMEEDELEVPSSTVTGQTTVNGGAVPNFFEFEDVEDLDEIVDFRPHGESPRSSCSSTQSNPRLQNENYATFIARRSDAMKRSSRPVCPDSRDEVDGCEAEDSATNPTTTSFHTLGSLDEEEVDSDESGYVEASPKSSMDRTELKTRNNELDKESQLETNNNKHNDDQSDVVITRTTCQDLSSNASPAKNVILADNADKAEFIKCPISETIKKLANASLRSSKAIRVSTNACLESINKSAAKQPEFDGESPSLLQRKRLLAQHGVTV